VVEQASFTDWRCLVVGLFVGLSGCQPSDNRSHNEERQNEARTHLLLEPTHHERFHVFLRAGIACSWKECNGRATKIEWDW
jgi:hypothetical protein